MPVRVPIVAVGVALIGLLADPVIAGTGRVYVNAAATGANTGGTWQDAYVSLETALQNAPLNSEIWVARGTYYPTRSLTPFPRPTFALRAGVGLYGGFAGGETARSQRDVVGNPTILSGDIGHNDPADLTDNTNPVVTDSGSDESAVLDGFTIRAGGGFVAATQPYGDAAGGLRLANSRATIVNCSIVSNVFVTSVMDPSGPAPGPNGAGALVSGGAPTFTNCTFRGNHAGRGISGPCQFGSPRPGQMPGGSGGAVYISGGAAPRFVACRFTDNAAGDGGNGFSCTQSAAGGGNGGSGGAIYSTASTPTFINCLFAHNAPGAGGSGASSPAGPAPAGSAGTSGGLELVSSAAVLVGCTIADNAGASGIRSDAATVRSSIIRNAGSGVFTGSTMIAYSLVHPLAAGAGNIDADPQFVDAAASDYRLRRTSPCVDAGDSSAFGAGVTTDLAGQPRFVDIAAVPDTGTGTAPIADMGAFEVQSSACPGDFNHNGVVSVQDLFDFLTAYFSLNPRADVNASGSVDTQDIFDFLAAYFAVCS